MIKCIILVVTAPLGLAALFSEHNLLSMLIVLSRTVAEVVKRARSKLGTRVAQ